MEDRLRKCKEENKVLAKKVKDLNIKLKEEKDEKFFILEQKEYIF